MRDQKTLKKVPWAYSIRPHEQSKIFMSSVDVKGSIMKFAQHLISPLVAITLCMTLVIQAVGPSPAAACQESRPQPISSDVMNSQALQLRSLMVNTILLPVPATALHQTRTIEVFQKTAIDHPFLAWTLGIAAGYVAISAVIAFARGTILRNRFRSHVSKEERRLHRSLSISHPYFIRRWGL